MIVLVHSSLRDKNSLAKNQVFVKKPSSLAYNLRNIMFESLKRQEDTEKLGGPDKVVCIDETHFTRRRHTRGGFQGRFTAGHETIILGMVELDLATRRETGCGCL